MKIFKFHEKWKNPKTGRFIKHVYTLDDKPLKGITSVLGVISKPALYQWYANMVIEYIKNKCAKDDKGCFMVLPEVLEKARTSANQKKDDSADIGTIAHKMVELFVNAKIQGKTIIVHIMDAVKDVEVELKKEIVLTTKDEEMIKIMFQNFMNWNTQNNPEYLYSEKKMYSEKVWVAGTVDLIFKMNGKTYIGDVKTYSGIYDRTPFLQCAGYDIMVMENGLVDKVDGYYIIRLGKDGTFDTHESYDREGDTKGFLAALELDNQLSNFTKSK